MSLWMGVHKVEKLPALQDNKNHETNLCVRIGVVTDHMTVMIQD